MAQGVLPGLPQSRRLPSSERAGTRVRGKAGTRLSRAGNSDVDVPLTPGGPGHPEEGSGSAQPGSDGIPWHSRPNSSLPMRFPSPEP